MAFRLIVYFLVFLISSPAFADWYILLPKERKERRVPPKEVHIQVLKKKKTPLKPYSVEVRKILAPSFVIHTSNRKLKKEELLGKNVVILFVNELFSPGTEKLAKEFEELSRKEGNVFIIVDVNDSDFAYLRKFKKLLSLKRVVVTADSYIFEQFRKNVKELSLPSIVIIDKHGFIRFFSPKLSVDKPEIVKAEIKGILKTLSKA